MQVSTSVGTGRKTQAETDRPVFPVGHMELFSLVTVLFFLWGMALNLTDILVQQFKKSFELSPVSAQLVQPADFLAYFFMARPAAMLMRRLGFQIGLGMRLPLLGVVWW